MLYIQHTGFVVFDSLPNTSSTMYSTVKKYLPLP